MATLNDVAKQAKVSYSAVSQILNNKERRARFSPETVERVQAAAAELGYKANQFAKSLKTGRTMIAGITSSRSARTGETFFQPYLSKMYAGVSDVLSKAGYRIILQNTAAGHHDDPTVELGEARITDGLIYILVSDDEEDFYKSHLPALKALGQPFVVIHSLPKLEGCDNVGIDAVTGGMKVVDHLTDQGYRRIGFVNRANSPRPYDNLLSGFTQAHHYMGIPFSNTMNLFVVADEGAEHGYRLINRLLAQKKKLPEAFFAINDWIAQGMMLRLQREGIRVPEDVAIIGYGDLIDQTYMYTGLTTLSQMAMERGWAAGSMLLKRMTGQVSGGEPEAEIVDPELVLRDTCGCRKRVQPV